MMHIRFLFDANKPAYLDKENGFASPKGSYFWAEQYALDWNVVYGHHVWSLSDIKIHENYFGARCYGIDTGMCFGGRLTALVFNSSQPEAPPEIVQVGNF